MPKRSASLIERAATVYDFAAHPRARVPVELLKADRDSVPPVESAGRGVSTSLDTNGVGLDPNGVGKVHTLHSAAPVAPTAVSAHAEPIAPAPLPFVSSVVETPRAPSPTVPESFSPHPGNARVEAIDRARLAQKGMIVPGAPIGSLAEEYRLVKRQLLLTAEKLAGARARTILVGSAKPGDGKTYSAVNLALSLAAERDVEVLLVDADFAKPDVMAELGLDEGPGLLDALADHAIDPEALVVRTDVPHLSLLPVGAKTHSDTELLASRRTAEVVERLLAADPRRIILFDSPPALAASPASVLASQVGQVMLVVRADRTTESDVRRAVGLLDGCEHIHLVLNAVSFVAGGDRFGSYYGQGD